jgi:hypothetical protein
VTAEERNARNAVMSAYRRDNMTEQDRQEHLAQKRDYNYRVGVPVAEMRKAGASEEDVDAFQAKAKLEYAATKKEAKKNELVSDEADMSSVMGALRMLNRNIRRESTKSSSRNPLHQTERATWDRQPYASDGPDNNDPDLDRILHQGMVDATADSENEALHIELRPGVERAKRGHNSLQCKKWKVKCVGGRPCDSCKKKWLKCEPQ